MTLIKWEPKHEIDNFFDRFTNTFGWPLNGGQELITTSDWTPRVDISETDNEFIIKAEIPDVKKEDIKVSVENGIFSIKGERKQEKEEKGKKIHRIERSYGSFFRSFSLPDNVDDTKIKATHKDGILSLQIPKSEKAKNKNIEIKIE